jgi:hypothetical protein
MSPGEGSLFVSYNHKDRDLVVTLMGMVPDVWYVSFIDFLHTRRGIKLGQSSRFHDP